MSNESRQNESEPVEPQPSPTSEKQQKKPEEKPTFPSLEIVRELVIFPANWKSDDFGA